MNRQADQRTANARPQGRIQPGTLVDGQDFRELLVSCRSLERLVPAEPGTLALRDRQTGEVFVVPEQQVRRVSPSRPA